MGSNREQTPYLGRSRNPASVRYDLEMCNHRPVRLPLAEAQIGVGIIAAPLGLRMSGMESRTAEAIILAAMSGDGDELRRLLPTNETPEEGGEPGSEESTDATANGWSVTDVYGSGPLALAASGGHANAVGLLLKARAAPDESNERDGQTALLLAAENGHDEVVAALLSGGADPATAAHDGTTALHAAARSGSEGVARLLLQRKEESEEGEELELSAAPAVSADAVDASGMTPLMAAAAADSAAVCALLCEAGACLEATDENGWSPFLHAAAANAVNAAAVLLQRGASRDHQSFGGHAAEKMQPDLLGGVSLTAPDESVSPRGGE